MHALIKMIPFQAELLHNEEEPVTATLHGVITIFEWYHAGIVSRPHEG